jgi:NCS2 family nucleobase:cation symporter-2
MANKPANLIYGVDDKPPFGVIFLLGVQHIFLMSSTLLLPVVLVSELGGSFEQVRNVVALTMIACGIGTILQAVRVKGFGSGFVCPNLCGPNFFLASMQAAWLGGLPLLRGMTVVAGIAEALFACFVNRLRFLFPAEITGLVVLMVAEGVVPIGVSKVLGINYEGEPIRGLCVLTAAVSLLTMAGVAIWGKKLRLYSVLIGMVTGYLLSFLVGILSPSQFRQAFDSPWMALPLLDNMFEITFKWSLVPIFVIVSITGALKSVGNLIMCEKVNDDQWKEPDMPRIANGLTADSVCVAVSGLIGGVASDTSASNVALSSASGATSRVIGYMAGTLFILLGLFPKVSGLLSVMPAPVMGAILIFVTSFMIMSAIQIIVGSGMDTRKTFVIGVALIFGLSLDILPSLFAGVPYFLRPLVDSSLTLSTVIAVVLNQLLRLRDSVKGA